jgi:hypothetical protein
VIVFYGTEYTSKSAAWIGALQARRMLSLSAEARELPNAAKELEGCECGVGVTAVPAVADLPIRCQMQMQVAQPETFKSRRRQACAIQGL